MRELVRRQDDHFLNMAATLTTEDWAAPSLCTGWSNRDVLAHLSLGQYLGLGPFVVEMGRQRGSFDRANDVVSRRHGAGHTIDQLLAEYDRERSRLRGIGALLPAPLLLGDHTVHFLDIMLSLGRDPELEPEVANAVLTVEATISNPFIPAKKNVRGLRLETTDTEWAHGEPGWPIVVGPAASLVSVIAGRPHHLDRLDGAGLATLRDRVRSSPLQPQ